MLTIGLTGGIGCGKSTAVQRFRELGVPVIEADSIAREIVQIGQPALAAIVQQFGQQVLQADGSLDRAWLRQIVFSDAQRLQQLETILHPRIRHTILTRIAGLEQTAAYVIVDVPLLFEKDYTQLFDRVLVIDCLPEQQKQRVKQRDNSEDAVIEAIIQSQLSRDERLRKADDVLNNTTSITDFYKKIDNLHDKYMKYTNT